MTSWCGRKKAANTTGIDFVFSLCRHFPFRQCLWKRLYVQCRKIHFAIY